MEILFENVEEFKYWGVTVTNTNDIPEEIKRRINMGNAFYYSLEKISSQLLSNKLIVNTYHHHYQTVLPKRRFFIANAGTLAAVLPKAGLPLQTRGPRFAVLLEMNRCGSFPLLSALTLSLASEHTLKDLKRSQGIGMGVKRVNLAN